MKAKVQKARNKVRRMPSLALPVRRLVGIGKRSTPDRGANLLHPALKIGVANYTLERKAATFLKRRLG